MKRHRILILAASISATFTAMLAGTVAQAMEIEEILVQGIWGSQQRALDVKRNSEVVMDGISLEAVGKFPDQNVAEALQRIPGVAITRERGEGAQVSVRGFGPTFNVVTLNDRVTASVLNTRSFDFQTLPSQLISGAQVYKSVDASRVEGSIGAGINISTLRPLNFNQDRIMAGTISGRYTDLGEDVEMQASGIYGAKFADDTVGLVLGFSRDDHSSRIDTSGGEGYHIESIESGGVLTGQDVRMERARNYFLQLEDRSRSTATAALQFQPNDRLDLNFDVLYTRLEVDTDQIRQQHVLFFGGTEDLVLSSNNTALSFTKPAGDIRPDLIRVDDYRDTQTTMFGFNAIFDATDTWSLEFDVAHSEATSDSDPLDLQNSFAVIRSITAGVGGDYDIDGGAFPELQLNQDLNDLEYRAFYTDFNAEDLEDKATDLKLKSLWTVDNGPLVSVEAGVQYVDRTKLEIQYRSPNGCAYCGSGPTIPDSEFDAFPVSNFLSAGSGFQNEWPVLSNSDYLAFLTLNDADRAAGLIPVLRKNQGTNVEEQSTSLFVQANLAGELGQSPWSGNFGVRYVKTDLTTRGATSELVDITKTNTDPLDGNITIDTLDSDLGAINNNYSEVLPSVNFKLSLNDDVQLRAAAAKVISRPNLSDLSTSNSFRGNGTSFTSSGGNPYLDPFKAVQYDLGIEYYSPEGSAYSASVFYKNIETFISNVVTLAPTEFSVTLPDPIGVLDPVVFTDSRVQNTDGGSVKGIEFSALHNFENLPEMFDGLGVQFNYTYADSESDIEPTVLPSVTAASSDLEGFAKNSFNAILFYEKNKISTRLAYNWVDDYLLQRQGAQGLPVYFADYGQLDLSFSYDLIDNLTLNIEGINISDQSTETYQDVRERAKDFEFTGRRFMVGISGTF